MAGRSRIAAPARWLGRMLAAVSIDQWRAIDRDTPREPGETGRFDWRVLVILATAAAALALQESFGDYDFFSRHFHARAGDPYWDLKWFAWWAAWRVIGYVVIPMIAIACMPGERIRDYYLSGRKFFRYLWIYVGLLVAFMPVVVYASTTAAFRDTYPFYRMANRSWFDLCAWEGLYAIQFLSLEFFFRGFLLQGLRRTLGSNAIFVMIVPYCMIHFGKPLPETLAAIAAGLILGTIAMRTRSIWGCVLIHVGVALSMDLLALHGCPPIGSGHYCPD